MPLAAVVHSKGAFWPRQSTPSSSFLYDIAVEVSGVQDEQECGLDQVRVGHWILGSMMVVACQSRTAGMRGIRSVRERGFLLGRVRGADSTVAIDQRASCHPPNRRMRQLSMLSILPISNAASWNCHDGTN